MNRPSVIDRAEAEAERLYYHHERVQAERPQPAALGNENTGRA